MFFLSGHLAVAFLARIRSHSYNSEGGAIVAVVFMAIVIAILVFVISYLKKVRKKTFEVWQTVAKVTGLQMKIPDKFILSGSYEGIDFSIYDEIRGSGKSRVTYTIFDAKVKNAGEHTLLIRRECSIIDAIGKVFGAQDIQLDDPEFNKSFIIKSDSEPFVRRIFTSKLRQILLEELKDATLVLNGSILKYSIIGLEKNGEKMISIISVMYELCKNIDDNNN